MAVELIRIDDRLIHGQVVTTWLKDYKLEQVIIVNDLIVKDEIQKSVFSLTAPSNVKIKVFGVEQFIEVLKKASIKRRTMILMTTSTDVLKLVKGGFKLNNLNVGGMRFGKNRKQLTKTVSTTEEEETAFKELINMGIEISIQMVPTDEKILLKNLI